MWVRMLLKGLLILGAVLLVPIAIAQPKPADQRIAELPWQRAPADGVIASVARISLPNGLRFLDEAATSGFLELNGNPMLPSHGVLAPEAANWFAVFSFESIGYVRSHGRLNANAMLRALQQGDANANADRRRRGIPTARTDGWAMEPQYDTETHRLEWATRLIDEQGITTVSYSTRILGRNGVMTTILLSDPQQFRRDVEEFRAALRGFNYLPGEGYTEFRQGDLFAEQGLTGLVGGTGAAGTSFLDNYGRIIGWGLLAVGVAAYGLFKRLFVRDDPNPDQPA